MKTYKAKIISSVNDSGFDYLKGVSVDIPKYGLVEITKVEREGSRTTIYTKGGKMFSYEGLQRQGFRLPEKQDLRKRGGSRPASGVITKRDYERTLKQNISSAKDDGTEDFTYDLAETLYSVDPDIRAYLQYHHPMWGKAKLIERLQWDMENLL